MRCGRWKGGKMILSLDRCAACDYVLIRRVWRVGPRTQQSGVLKFREVEKTLFTKNIFKKIHPRKKFPCRCALLHHSFMASESKENQPHWSLLPKDGDTSGHWSLCWQGLVACRLCLLSVGFWRKQPGCHSLGGIGAGLPLQG